MLYLCGGELDPNVAHLRSALRRRRQAARTLVVGASSHPALHWDLQSDALKIDGRAARPTAVFLRYDVFSTLADGRPESAYRAHCWYATLEGWLLAHPSVRMLNRRYDGTTNKAATLCLARDIGFTIPRTVVSNDLVHLSRSNRQRGGRLGIVKPVIGGEHTQRLDAVLSEAARRGRSAAAPAIVQEELVPPEVRVYRVGPHLTAFRIVSSHLDYRTDARCVVELLPALPPGFGEKLLRLTDALGLDYAAADFKANSRTGALEFLEVNSAPMFVAFDRAASGRLCAQILELLEPEVAAARTPSA